MSEEREPNIRVKDRRMFNSDGSLRSPDAVPDEDASQDSRSVVAPAREPELVSAPSAPAAAAPEPAPERAPEATAAVEEDRNDPHGEPSLFGDLIVNLASQAAMYLGLVDNPLAPKMPTDPHAARQMIDILGMLQEKTRGNLTTDEAVLIERILTDLRMQYVGITKTRR